MREHTLEPITPQEAKETYLDERENARYATRQTIEDVVELFVEWTEEDGIENMNNIRGRQLRQFKNWCQNTSDNNTVSLNGIMSSVRRFLVYCVEIEAVYPSVPNKTPIPNVPDDEDVSDEFHALLLEVHVHQIKGEHGSHSYPGLPEKRKQHVMYRRVLVP